MPAVRQRTLAHLQRLMAASALASCSRDPDPVKQDPITPAPTASATPSASVAADPPPTAAPPPSAAPTAKPTPKPQPRTQPTGNAGYLVVDMLPAPARCLAVAKTATIAGGFVADPSGTVLRFTVTLNTPTVSFASTTPQAIGATLLSSSFPNWSTAEIEVRPTGGQLASVQLMLSCGSYGSAMLVVHATFAGPPAIGRPVTLTMTDY